MRYLVVTIILSLSILKIVNGQDIQSIYQKAMEEHDKGKYKSAIKYIDQCILIDSTIANLWFNRGIFHTKSNDLNASIEDFNKAILIDPLYKKAYNSRGNSKQDITDYDGAIDDYKKAISIDSTYIDAIWNLAETYEKKKNTLCACYNYKRASELGDNEALQRLNFYRVNKLIRDTSLILTEYTTDTSYGYSALNPIFVGNNIYTGPQSERYFLDQLYDLNGIKVKYERVQSCCQYPSKNGFMGFAMLDVYRIYYTDSNSNNVTQDIFISMYDYNKPLIPLGFKNKK